MSEPPSPPGIRPLPPSGWMQSAILFARSRVGRPRVATVCRLLLLLLLILPTLHFTRVAVGRMGHPFELEWLEGEVAIYSLRWQEQRSIEWLYPPFEEGSYVPHLYPPFFQIVAATVNSVIGGHMLGSGRFVSFLATLAIMGAALMIVRESTGSWFAGACAALLYPAFFKPSGYWYDLNRVDSLAWALAMWSVWCIVRRSGGLPTLMLGLGLAFLAQFTKQTAIFLPVLALAVRASVSLIQSFGEGLNPRWCLPAPRGVPYYRHPRIIFPVLIFMIIVALNAVYFLRRTDALSHVWFYLYEVGKSHPIYYDNIRNGGHQHLWQYHIFLVWLLPIALWSAGLLRKWQRAWEPPLAVLLGGVVALWANHSLHGLMQDSGMRVSPRSSMLSRDKVDFVMSTWPVSFRWAVSWALGGLAVCAQRWLAYRTLLPGVWWLGALFAAQFIAAVTWVKIGGYINNFMPLFAVNAVVFGLCVAWMFRSFERVGGRVGSVVALLVVGVIFHLTWTGTRDRTLRRDPTQEWARREIFTTPTAALPSLPWWATDGLRYHKRPIYIRRALAEEINFGRPPADNGDSAFWIAQDGKRYGNQLPPESTREWGPRLLERLEELHAAGGVYLPHHNYLGMRAGVPAGPSIDAIRDVSYAGKPTPAPLVAAVRERRWRYIVTRSELRHEWMTADFRRAVEENYRHVGPLLEGIPWDAYRPVTGAPERPMELYEAIPADETP